MRRAFLIAAVAAAAFAAEGAATVPPTNCGGLRVGSKTYTVKTHLVSCKFAKTWTTRYLKENRKPSGFTCKKFDPRQTRIRFRCYRGDKDFFAIRR